MANRLPPNEQVKKKRGRPPGPLKEKTALPHKRERRSSATSKLNPVYTATIETNGYTANSADQAMHNTSNEEYITPFSTYMQTIMHRDRIEIARVARELTVAENTVYRWMNGTSEPRANYLKRLPEVFPEHRTQLINVINETFGEVIGAPVLTIREVQADTYRRALEITANSQDSDTLFWQISELIFDDALTLLDTEQLGLAITYAKLMPPHEDGIHSLREVKMHGHAPWPETVDSKAFLGSTTLVGSAAVSQRMQVWNDIDNNRTLVDIDDNEHSACAVPVIRGNRIAGVLIVSSTQADFFNNPSACQAVSEYALLMGVALCDRDFYTSALLHLRPMLPLKEQRAEISRDYVRRIIAFAHKNATSRCEAEAWIQHEMELEFEAKARTVQ
ncbi:GAF domain-containing protein [Dictyobacter arantiisoli]|uniref:GAF domain-containing protein n=1 Tax=Dictyobacter arantiisoli TaxID=2014874 RepID=A0A5A5T532_9CHLR|nr:GAF domain-containing protein [Dictyobacter arantiisoli]GCF06451.1 hypothetical protein KDI_00150 [Dictyobacter arantiisoli]